MAMLVASRALQGIGGGAITVTASALIGEVVPLRERGRYQGILGAVFGVTTVVGPLLGGYFTDYLTWRWAFWVNVPVSVLVIFVAAAAIPSLASSTKPVIDYAGIVLVGLGASGLTLATSWGGTLYPWGSPTIIGSVRRRRGGTRRVCVGGKPCVAADPADPTVREPSVHGVLCVVVRGGLRDVGRDDVSADLHAVRRWRVGDDLWTAHAADGGRDADHLDRQRHVWSAGPAATRSFPSPAPH